MALKFLKRKVQRETPKSIEPESIEMLGEKIDKDYRRYLTLQLGDVVAAERQVNQMSMYFNLSDGEVRRRKIEAISEFGKKKAEEILNGRARSTKKVELLSKACGATKDLSGNYDMGIALATDGLYLGYIAQKFGFPVLNVKMDRIMDAYDATWNPIDEITQKQIEGKRIVVFENDVITGRTLRKAINEINKLNPDYADLLLVTRHAEVSPARYQELKERGFIGKDVKDISGFKDLYYGGIVLDITYQIPREFRKAAGLEQDFKPDWKTLKEFEQKFTKTN